MSTQNIVALGNLHCTAAESSPWMPDYLPHTKALPAEHIHDQRRHARYECRAPRSGNFNNLTQVETIGPGPLTVALCSPTRYTAFEPLKRVMCLSTCYLRHFQQVHAIYGALPCVKLYSLLSLYVLFTELIAPSHNNLRG